MTLGGDLGEPDEEASIDALYDAAVARVVEARRALDGAKAQVKLCEEEFDTAYGRLLHLREDAEDGDARYTQMTLDAQRQGEDGDT